MSGLECEHDWDVWDEGEYRQTRRCRKCPSQQWRDSLLPKQTRGWIRAEFERARRRSESVPEWARPKLHQPASPDGAL